MQREKEMLMLIFWSVRILILSKTKIPVRIIMDNLSKRLISFKKVKYARVKRDLYLVACIDSYCIAFFTFFLMEHLWSILGTIAELFPQYVEI